MPKPVTNSVEGQENTGALEHLLDGHGASFYNANVQA